MGGKKKRGTLEGQTSWFKRRVEEGRSKEQLWLLSAIFSFPLSFSFSPASSLRCVSCVCGHCTSGGSRFVSPFTHLLKVQGRWDWSFIPFSVPPFCLLSPLAVSCPLCLLPISLFPHHISLACCCEPCVCFRLPF